jgi:hypothetical protein
MSIRRKALALFLTLALVVSMAPSLASAVGNSYTDVPSTHWANGVIAKWSGDDYGVLQGNGDGTFAPSRGITLGELATILSKTFGYTERTAAEVSPAWADEAVEKAIAAGVVAKTVTVDASAAITREQAIRYIAIAYSVAPIEGETTFADNAAIGAEYKPYINAFQKLGYVVGKGNGVFDPKASYTRAEAMQVIENTTAEIADGDISDKIYSNSLIVRKSGVTLKDATVNGDLIIGQGVGDGDVTLDNVTVEGRLIAYGGGSNSIHITGNSKIYLIISAKDFGEQISYRVEGNAEVYKIETTQGTKIVIFGDVQSVDVAENASVTLVAGTIDAVTIAGAGGSLVAQTNATVNTVSVEANNATVSGNGKVKEVSVADTVTSSVTVSTPGTKINNNSNTTVSTSTGGGNSSGGNSGGNTGGGGTSSGIDTHGEFADALVDTSITYINISGSFIFEAFEPATWDGAYSQAKVITIPAGVTLTVNGELQIPSKWEVINNGEIKLIRDYTIEEDLEQSSDQGYVHVYSQTKAAQNIVEAALTGFGADTTHGWSWHWLINIYGKLSGTGKINVDLSAYNSKNSYTSYGTAHVGAGATISSTMSGIEAQTGITETNTYTGTLYMFVGDTFHKFRATADASATDITQEFIDEFAASAPTVEFYIGNRSAGQKAAIPSLTVPVNAHLGLNPHDGGGLYIPEGTEIINNGILWSDYVYDDDGSGTEFGMALANAIAENDESGAIVRTSFQLHNGAFEITEDFSVYRFSLYNAQVTISGEVEALYSDVYDEWTNQIIAIENGYPSKITIAEGGKFIYKVGKNYDSELQEYTDWDVFELTVPGDYWYLDDHWHKYGETAVVDYLTLQPNYNVVSAGRTVETPYLNVYGQNGPVTLAGEVTVKLPAGTTDSYEWIDLSEGIDFTIASTGKLLGLSCYSTTSAALTYSPTYSGGGNNVLTADDFYYKYGLETGEYSSQASTRISWSIENKYYSQNIYAYLGAKITLTAEGQAPWLWYLDNASDTEPAVAVAGVYIMTKIDDNYAAWVKQ